MVARHPALKLPSRLQQSKQASTDARQQLEELMYEDSYLQAELQWQKGSKQAMIHFWEEIFQTFHFLENALIQVTMRLHDSEQQYLSLSGFSSVGHNQGGWFKVILIDTRYACPRWGRKDVDSRE